MKVTLSVIKADIGGYVGHSESHPDVLARAGENMAKAKKQVVGLGLKPHLEKLIQISGIPQGTPTAMICVSECSALNMKRSLESAGIQALDASACGIDDPLKLAETLSGRTVVIASDLAADGVRPLLQPGQELIVLDYLALDEAGISLLRSMVTEEPPVA